MKRVVCLCAIGILTLAALACARPPEIPAWEKANPVIALPGVPLGLDQSFDELPPADRPTPERVRLGRWLFFDKRLSADGSIACATCHQPEFGFSEREPHSTGIKGQIGARKAPSCLNLAWTLYPNFFWDGRAKSLEEQALGPIANPIEMGNTHEGMVRTLTNVKSYAPYFTQAFGSEEITKERVAKAIADYERTLLSGNSPWDRWKKNKDETAVSEEVKLGDSLFFGKAACSQCHLGGNLTDTTFHNLGVGWNPATKSFADDGRYGVTKKEEDRGAFRTPGLREVSRHPPYMHDGSIATLRAVVEHYSKGGNPNPGLDPKVTALKLTDPEVNALVKFMEALKSQGPVPQAPAAFPM